MIEKAIYQRLTGFAGVSALVAARVYPQLPPEAPVYPLLTYEFGYSARESAMVADTGIVHARLLVTAHAKTYLSACGVADQVRLALQRWGATLDSTEVLGTFVEDIHDEPPELINGELIRLRLCEFTVHYRE